MISKIPRYLSIFHPRRQKWVPVYPARPARIAEVSQPLSLLTWNIDFASSLAARRTKSIMDNLFSTTIPDIVFLQEVCPEAHTSLLNSADVRQHCLITDAEDNTAFSSSRRYTNVTLLARKKFDFAVKHEDIAESKDPVGYTVSGVYRKELPSAFGRTGVYVDLIPDTAPTTYIRLINTHLESYDNATTREKQITLLSQDLHEPGCAGGLIAGDFNAVCPEDHRLLDAHKLQDVWPLLRKSQPDAATWGNEGARHPGYPPARLDKIAVSGLRPLAIDIIRPGCIDVPMPGTKSGRKAWSDHSGLLFRFTTE